MAFTSSLACSVMSHLVSRTHQRHKNTLIEAVNFSAKAISSSMILEMCKVRKCTAQTI